MAAVLICEPHGDISSLLELVVTRLGHTPVRVTGGEVDPAQIDAAIVEPGEAGCLRVATRLAAAGVPVLFTSIFPPDDATESLRPAAYLLKPFPLYRLAEALTEALGPAPHSATAAN